MDTQEALEIRLDERRCCDSDQAVQQWQPIETAPWDIDILVADDDGGVHLVSHSKRGEGWYDGTTLHSSDMPTHWMHVPEPPLS